MIYPGMRGIFECVERTIVDEEMKLFVVTGQTPGPLSAVFNEEELGLARSKHRKAFPSLRPFHTLTAPDHNTPLADSEAFDEDKTNISRLVDLRDQSLLYIDRVTRTATKIPFADLDDDVKTRLVAASREEYQTKLNRILSL